LKAEALEKAQALVLLEVAAGAADSSSRIEAGPAVPIM
jgi:hypothetical protein